MKVKSESEVAQSCPTLSDPMDCGPPGSSTHGIFQARVLENCLLRVTGLDDINSRSDIAEEKVSELENTAQGTIQNKKIHKIYDGSILNSVIGNWNKMLWLKRQ